MFLYFLLSEFQLQTQKCMLKLVQNKGADYCANESTELKNANLKNRYNLHPFFCPFVCHVFYEDKNLQIMKRLILINILNYAIVQCTHQKKIMTEPEGSGQYDTNHCSVSPTTLFSYM